AAVKSDSEFKEQPPLRKCGRHYILCLKMSKLFKLYPHNMEQSQKIQSPWFNEKFNLSPGFTI
ncbi:MAG: hypothetical protein L3J57_11560, partial [Desulfuromusa sp.]|nr:hypothetical protein [Desulfuromusa sp.]